MDVKSWRKWKKSWGRLRENYEDTFRNMYCELCLEEYLHHQPNQLNLGRPNGPGFSRLFDDIVVSFWYGEEKGTQQGWLADAGLVEVRNPFVSQLWSPLLPLPYLMSFYQAHESSTGSSTALEHLSDTLAKLKLKQLLTLLIVLKLTFSSGSLNNQVANVSLLVISVKKAAFHKADTCIHAQTGFMAAVNALMRVIHGAGLMEQQHVHVKMKMMSKQRIITYAAEVIFIHS
ncbi:hypothetical protein C8J56DRAFT_1020684 [Mycena floridula]|nr:hypothetical protein C8J56DRAFT_1020684 [Mycena floridula]